MKLLGICLVVVFTCLGFSRLGAEIYYWTDEDGVKHYSNDPPPAKNVSIETAEEIPNDPLADEQRDAVAEKTLKEIIDEFEKESESQLETESPETKIKIPAQAGKPQTRQELIQKEKEKLEDIIAHLERQPVASFHNQRSKQQYIGRYRQKLQKLLESPDSYFGW